MMTFAHSGTPKQASIQYRRWIIDQGLEKKQERALWMVGEYFATAAGLDERTGYDITISIDLDGRSFSFSAI